MFKIRILQFELYSFYCFLINSLNSQHSFISNKFLDIKIEIKYINTKTYFILKNMTINPHLSHPKPLLSEKQVQIIPVDRNQPEHTMQRRRNTHLKWQYEFYTEDFKKLILFNYIQKY